MTPGMEWAIFGVSVAFLWSWRGFFMRNHMARRRWAGEGEGGRVNELLERDAARDGELEQLRTRVNELENRLDFAERLLTSRSEQREGTGS